MVGKVKSKHKLLHQKEGSPFRKQNKPKQGKKSQSVPACLIKKLFLPSTTRKTKKKNNNEMSCTTVTTTTTFSSRIAPRMVETLTSMAFQNNHGVSLFRSGRYVEALESFNETLRVATSYLRQEQRQCKAAQQQQQVNCCVLSQDERRVLVRLEVTPVLQQDVDEEESTMGSSSLHYQRRLLSSLDSKLYSCPIHLNLVVVADTDDDDEKPPLAPQEQEDDHDDHIEDDYTLISKLSTCLIFNTGLSHHGTALSEASTVRCRRQMLEKARDLYNLCYQFQVESHMPNPVLILASCNNLGRCYSMLQDKRASASCYEILLRCMMLFNDNQRLYQQHAAGNDDDDDTSSLTTSKAESSSSWTKSDECFYNNMMFLILKDPKFAPAA
jgi:hypothetical protein